MNEVQRWPFPTKFYVFFKMLSLNNFAKLKSLIWLKLSRYSKKIVEEKEFLEKGMTWTALISMCKYKLLKCTSSVYLKIGFLFKTIICLFNSHTKPILQPYLHIIQVHLSQMIKSLSVPPLVKSTYSPVDNVKKNKM